MTPKLAKVYATPLPGEGGAAWAALKAADGYQTVKVVETPSEGADGGTRARRFEEVSVTDRDAKGEPLGEPQQLVVAVTLTRASGSGQWRVDEVHAS